MSKYNLAYQEHRLFAIQKSTRTRLIIFQKINEKLRLHFKWYYNLLIDPLYLFNTPDEQMAAIQKSTRTTFKRLQPLHEKCRQKSRWYYKWHIRPESHKIHWAALVLYMIAIIVGLSYGALGGKTSNVKAANACASNVTSGNWNATGSWTSCGGVIPQPGDSVTILSGHTITMTADASNTTGSITINSGGTLNIGNYNLTTTDLTNAGTLTAGSANTLNIAGNFTNTGTFTANTSTLNMTAGTTGKTISPGASALYNVTLNNASGGWIMNDTTTINNNLTVTAGTLSGGGDVTVKGGNLSGNGTVNMTAGTITVTGTGNFGGSSAWTFSNLTFGDGSISGTTTNAGTGGLTIGGKMNIKTNHSLLAGASTWTLDSIGATRLSGIKQISVGGSHICALKSDTTVVCWGSNSAGQVGDNTSNNNRAAPTPVVGVGGSGTLSGVTAISAGDSHTCALKSDKTMVCWGSNAYGQIGDNTSGNTRTAPTVVVAVGGSGTLSSVTAISAGWGHTCALKSDQTVNCWGYDYYGQIGDNYYGTILRPAPVAVLSAKTTSLSGVTAIAAGVYHTCALKSDQSVVCWGQNINGQMGDGTYSTTKYRVLASTAVKINSTTNLSGATSIGSGNYSSCASKSDGSVVCWGKNDYGQIGDNTSGTDRLFATSVVNVGGSGTLGSVSTISVGWNHVCALKTDKTMVCWGNDSFGTIGDNSSGTNRLAPVVVTGVGGSGTLGDVSSISAGSNNSCALKNDRSVLCWGYNYSNQIGDGTATDRLSPTAVASIDIGNLGGILSIEAGQSQTCALKNDQTVACWGSNAYGQIGDNAKTDRYTPTTVKDVGGSGILRGVTAISVGYYNACALKSDQTVVCWGYNYYGQIGDNTSGTDRLVPTVVKDVGGSGTLSGVTAISAGSNFACALKSDQTMVCWGYNYTGQLGDNSTNTRLAPVVVKDTSGSGTLGSVTAISAGDAHVCALKSDQTMVCWGNDASGQIGDATSGTNRLYPVVVKDVGGSGTLGNVTAISAGYNHTCALKSGQTVVCWGNNSNGQIGDATSGTNRLAPVVVVSTSGSGTLGSVTAISTGRLHTCALKSDQTMVCWGDNTRGQIGDNTSGTNRLYPVVVKNVGGSGNLSNISNVMISGDFSCALKTDQTGLCWGNDGSGQIGDNTNSVDHLFPVQIIIWSATPLTTTGTFTPQTSTFEYKNTTYTADTLLNINVANVTYNKLKINQASNFFPLAGNTTVNSDFTVTAGNLELLQSSQTLTIGGNYAVSDNFLPGTATVIFNSSGTQTLTTGGTGPGKAFYNLTHSGTGTIDISGNNLEVTHTFSNDGTLKLTGDETVTLTNDSDSGTVEYAATSGSRTIKNWPYYSLKINGSGGTFVLPASEDLNGNLDVLAGTLDANNYNINVAGNWNTTGGTFTPKNGGGATTQTVTFDSPNPATVTGSTTFNNLTMDASVDGAKTITFAAGSTQTITSGKTWTLNGASGKVLTLRSGTQTSPWYFNISAPMTSGVYIDVEDSYSANSNKITPGSNVTSSGNNNGWIFTSGGNTITGSLYDGIGGAKITSAAKTINCSVNGGAPTTAETSGGDFSVTTSAALAANDIITLYVSAETEKASTVTKVSATGDLSGIDLYQNYTTIRHEGSITALTNTDLATADNLADSDELFSVNGSSKATFTQGLYILTAKTYAPGGDTAATNINIAGTLNAGSYTHTVAGNWTSSAGTFTYGTSTINFTGGTPTFTPSSQQQFYSLNFITAGQTVTFANRIITWGHLTVGSTFGNKVTLLGDPYIDMRSANPLTLNGTYNANPGYNINNTAMIFRPNASGVIPTGTYGDLIASSDGNQTITLQGNVTSITLQVYGMRTGNLTTLDTSSNNYSISTSSIKIGYSDSVSQFGKLIINNSTVSVSGFVNIFLNYNGDTVHNTLDATGSGTVNVSGNWTNNDTFTEGSSTVNFNGSGDQTISGSAALEFYHISVCKTGGQLILGANVTLAGSEAMWPLYIISNTTINLQSYNFTFTQITDGIYVSASSSYNFFTGTGKLIFLADSSINSESAVGTFGFGNIQIGDASHTPVVYLNDMAGGATFSFTDVTILNNSDLDNSGNGIPINVSGNWTNAGAFVNGSSTVDFTAASGTQTLNSGGTGAGQAFYNLTHSGAGTVSLLTNDLAVSGALNLTAGTLTTLDGSNSINLTVGGNVTVGTGATLTANASTITVAGNWDSSAGTFNYDTSIVNLTGTGSVTTLSSTATPRFYNLSLAYSGHQTTIATTGGSYLIIDNILTLNGGALTTSDRLILFMTATDTPLTSTSSNSTLTAFSIVYLANLVSLANTTVNIGISNVQTINANIFLSVGNKSPNMTFALAGNLSVPMLNMESNAAGTIFTTTTNSYSLSVTNDFCGSIFSFSRNTLPKTLYFNNSTVTIGRNFGTINTLTYITSDITDNLYLGGSQFSVGGNFLTKNTGTTYTNYLNVTPGNSTVYLTGASGTQTFSPAGSGTGSFNNLVHSGAGTVQLAGTLSVNGNFSQTAGTFDANSYNQNFAGDFSLSDNTTYIKGGTLTFDGTTAATYTDSNATTQDLGAVVLNKTDINDPANNNKLSLASSMAVDSLNVDGTAGSADSLYTGLIGGNILTVNDGATTIGTNGTISGSGQLDLIDTAGANLSTTGTLSTAVRFTTATADIAIPARTYGDNVEVYNNTSSNYNAVLGTDSSQTIDISGNLNIITNSTGEINFKADTNNPTTNILGNLTTSKFSSGAINLNMGTGTWNVSGNVDLTGSTVTPDSSTLILNSTSAGQTLTSAGQSLYNLTVTNNTSSGVTFADSLTLASGGTFTDTTDGSKLIFTDNATYTFPNINIHGSSDHNVVMTKTSGSNHWNFVVSQASPTVTYVTVDHSNATGSSAQINATSNCTNGGSNVYWQFVVGSTITGSLYDSIGGAKITSTAKTINCSVNGGAATTAETSGGDFSISASSVLTANDIITLYVSGETEKASTVTKVDAAGNLSGIDLYQNYTTIRHEGSITALTNTDLAIADNLADSDELFSVDGSSKAAFTQGLYILTVKTYTPGGDVAVAGNWVNSGTFTAGSSAVTFNGTTSQTITTNAQPFYDLILNNTGTSGSDKLTISGLLDVNDNLILTDGNLDLATNDPNVTLAGNVTIGANGSWTKQDGGMPSTTFDGNLLTGTFTDSSTGGPQDLGFVIVNKSNAIPASNLVTLASSMTVDTMSISANNTLNLGSGGYTFTLANAGAVADVLTNLGTLTPGTSTVKYTATNSSGNINIAVVPYNNLRFSGAETYTTNNSLTGTNALTGNLTVDTGATLSGANDITVTGGSATGDGTINMTAGTITLTGSGNFGGASPWTFANLTFGDGTTSGTTTNNGAGNPTVKGRMNILANHNLQAGSSTWTLDGFGSTPLANIKQVAAGNSHTCALKSDQTVVCWGNNDYGQIGDNTTGINRFAPTVVKGVGGSGTLGSITAIAAGYYHTCALKSDQTVVCWGYNAYGQIGDNTSGTNRLAPTVVKGVGGSGTLSGVSAITTGNHHTCALKSDQTVVCWGYNNNGQIGDNTTGTNRLAPVVVVDVGGSGTLGSVTAIAAGYYHTCALKSNQTAVCWGFNSFGSIGDNTSGTNRLAPTVVKDVGGSGTLGSVIAIAAGSGHTCAVKSDQTVVCWGNNSYGQIGDNTSGNNRLAPTVVKGVGGSGTLGGVSSITTGNYHTCARKSDQTVVCWGYNNNGQIGDNTFGTNRLTPTVVKDASGSGTLGSVTTISAGYYYTCALKSDQTVVCWGNNDYGQIGDNTSGTNRLAPTVVKGVGGSGTLGSVIAIAAGYSHICALKSDQTVVCWGYNNNGQIGDNTSGTNRLTPTVVKGVGGSGTLGSVTAIAAGYYHTCALKSDQTVVCWGNNSYGQIGDNTSGTNRLTPTVVKDVGGSGTLGSVTAISAGYQHTCALKSDQTVVCWGYNSNGQIGDNTSGANRLAPVVVVDVGGSGTLSSATSIIASSLHTCALKSDQTVVCWGSNAYGQIGDNTSGTNRLAPTVVKGVGGTGTLGSVTAVAAGYYHTCARKSDQTVVCWGYNNNGQIGDNTSGTNRLAPTVVKDVGGSGTLGSVATITAGYYHTCALKGDQTVVCWGQDTAGQLGDNTSVSTRLAPVNTIVYGGSPLLISGTLTPQSSTFEYKCTNSYTDGQLVNTIVTPATYNNLKLNQTGQIFSVSSNFTTSANLDITAGQMEITGSPNISVGGNWTNAGTIFPGSSTVIFTKSSGTQTLVSGGTDTGYSFNNLTHSGAGILQLSTNALDINGNFLNDTNAGTFDANGQNIKIAKNWTITGGSFTAGATPGSQTVTFDSTNESDISGSATFNNLTMDASIDGAKTIKFTNGTIQTISSGKTWTLNGASGKVLTLRSTSDTNPWYFNISAPMTSGSYIDVEDSYSANANKITPGSNVINSGNNEGWIFSQASNPPTNLAQKKTNDTVLAMGDWTNETSVKFTASATDPDTSDTLQLCVEKKPLGVSFANTEDSCGTGVAYSGTAVAVNVTISGLTDATQYHWQARVKDASSSYSTWQSYPDPTPNNESIRDFGVDTTAPTTGTVNDGTGTDVDYNDGSLTTLSANWLGITDTISGIKKYEYAIGTTSGGTDTKTWTDNGTNTSVTDSSLTLRTSQSYYVTVRVTDNAGNVSTPITSNGQAVAPTLTFGYSGGNNVTFNDLNASDNYTDDTKQTILQTSTNAFNGYVIKARAIDALRSPSNINLTIAHYLGTNINPTIWSGTGFGYTTSDNNLSGGTPDRFTNGGPKYAGWTETAPGDPVADHTANVVGTPITNEQFTITYRVTANALTAAGLYRTMIVYTAIPQY